MTLPHMRHYRKSEKKSWRQNGHTGRLCIYALRLLGIWTATWRRQGVTANLQCETALSRSPRTCCFRSSWMTRILTSGALAMFMNMVLLGKCDQLWVFGKNISEGMAAETGKAEKRGMAIRHFTEGMKEVDES